MCGHDVKTYISYFFSQIAFFACTWEISVGWGKRNKNGTLALIYEILAQG
jgi:hypothetical protein